MVRFVYNICKRNLVQEILEGARVVVCGRDHRLQGRHQPKHLAAAGPDHAGSGRQRLPGGALRHRRCPFRPQISLRLQPRHDAVFSDLLSRVGRWKRGQVSQADRCVQVAEEILRDGIVVDEAGVELICQADAFGHQLPIGAHREVQFRGEITPRSEGRKRSLSVRRMWASTGASRASFLAPLGW